MENEGECDSQNFSGWINIGGRGNVYGDQQGRHSKQKPSKKVEIAQNKHTNQQRQGGGYPHGPHPPAAISYAYSFTPYQQYPPPPPYQYGGYGGPALQMAGGGHGYYGSSQMAAGGGRGYYGSSQIPCGGHGYYGGGGYHGQGYPGQYSPPNQGGYNYGMSHNYSGVQHMNMQGSSLLPDHGGAATAATGVPMYRHGQHDMVNKQLGQDHNHGGTGPHVMNKEGLAANGGAEAVGAGAAADGLGKHDAVNNKHAHHDHSQGGGHMAMGGGADAGAPAATCGGHGFDAVNKHAHYDHSHGRGHMTMGGASAGAAASAAAATYGHHGQHYAVKHAYEHNQGGGHLAMGVAAASAATAVYSHG